MEKAISEEEKIRRAIEISQRRNQNYYTRETARVNINNRKDYKLFRRMIIQIVICLLIYLIFYLITSTNYIFSDTVIKSTKDILNYDINIESLYNNFINLINKNNEVKVDSINENQMQENTIENIITNTENDLNNSSLKDLEEQNNISSQEISVEKTQMELDAEEVKKMCEFQKPLNGTISSEFGEREVTSSVMSADHKGIDIAAKNGTNIKAAMTGEVSVAEENSEYGKFIKITNGEVMTVYAHCSELKVKEGEKVKIGQTIAKVGSTGNSTGPHLHFEIRLSNRYINPKYVIDF